MDAVDMEIDVPLESGEDSSSNNDGVSEVERSAKRPRLSANENEEENDVGSPQESTAVELPPEVWARVMEHLPFDTVLACGATSRSILHNAMPRLTTLHIDKPYQMNMNILNRFRDIKEVHINSLLSLEFQDDFREVFFSQGSLTRVVPFLSRIISLERVVFNVKDEDGNIVKGYPIGSNGYFYVTDEAYPNEGSRESMFMFLDMLSGAFNCGALSSTLRVSGLCCPDSTNDDRRSDSCEVCLRACQSFPLKSVLEFECRGSSENNARSGRMYGLDVCLEHAQIESIIESRGGSELLRSPDRLMRLLGCGRRYRIESDEGRILYIVKYTQEQLGEIKRAIEYAELDVNKICAQDVHNAILNSFAVEGSSTIIPMSQRFLSMESIDHLVDEIGLPVVKDECMRPLVEMRKHVEQLISALLTHHQPPTVDNPIDLDYSDIESDCLRLLRLFLEAENDSPIQLMTANVITCLAKSIQTGSDNKKMDAATSLNIILSSGTMEQQQMVIDDETVIKSFSKLIDSSGDSPLAKLAMNVLVNIATEGKAVNIQHIDAGAIRKLVNLLDTSKGADRIKSSLSILDEIVSKGTISNIESMATAGALTKLIHLIDADERGQQIDKSLLRVLLALKDHTKGVNPELLRRLVGSLLCDEKPPELLVDCTMMLRNVFQSNIGVYSRRDTNTRTIYNGILELMKLKKSEASIFMNLAHAVANLLAESKDQAWTIVQQQNFVQSGIIQGLGEILVSLPDPTIPLTALSNISLQSGFNTRINQSLIGKDDKIVRSLIANLSSPDRIDISLRILDFGCKHISTLYQGRLINRLITIMEVPSSQTLGAHLSTPSWRDVNDRSSGGGGSGNKNKRLFMTVLKSLPPSDTKKPQSIRFHADEVPGREMVLCWVDSEKKLHHHYTYSGRPLDHTEKTYVGDAFVMYSVSSGKAKPQTLSDLGNNAYHVLCSYRVQEVVDNDLYRHDIKWTPKECVVSCASNPGILNQEDMLFTCSVILRKIYTGTDPVTTQQDIPSRLEQIMKLDHVSTITPSSSLSQMMKTMASPQGYASRIRDCTTIHTNIEHSLLGIAIRLTGTKEDIMKDINVMQDAGIHPLLVNLVVSQDDKVSNTALLAVSHIVSLAPASQNMLLQAGIMKRLMILLKSSQIERSKLKVVLLAYARCCQGKPHDVTTSKAILSILSRILFIQYDEETLGNACFALFNVLDGMEQDQVEGIDLGFVEHLLKMLPDTKPNVQLTVLKTLHLLANTGETCIKAIIDHNGMVCLCKMLSSQCETSHKLAFDAIRCIVSLNKKHMQTAIDNGLVQYLCQMLAQNMEESMQAINTILSSGCDSQIKSLLDQVK